ncbi:hypothetical protein WJX81_002958 [Elliptochloris bilobata]|uniref:SCP domain-containing protein n=1 Tax=Elliptochloris bilobata TaxID=381761 RepID=A0AAW1RU88_9CHLO
MDCSNSSACLRHCPAHSFLEPRRDGARPSSERTAQQLGRCVNAVRQAPHVFADAFNRACNYSAFVEEMARPQRTPLAVLPELSSVAQAHAVDQAAHGALGSYGSSGSTPLQRVRSAAPGAAAVGELVAAGYASVLDTVAAFVCAPQHRQLLMSCRYDMVGWGIALPAAANGRGAGVPFVTGDFLCLRPGGCQCSSSAAPAAALPPALHGQAAVLAVTSSSTLATQQADAVHQVAAGTAKAAFAPDVPVVPLRETGTLAAAGQELRDPAAFQPLPGVDALAPSSAAPLQSVGKLRKDVMDALADISARRRRLLRAGSGGAGAPAAAPALAEPANAVAPTLTYQPPNSPGNAPKRVFAFGGASLDHRPRAPFAYFIMMQTQQPAAGITNPTLDAIAGDLAGDLAAYAAALAGGDPGALTVTAMPSPVLGNQLLTVSGGPQAYANAQRASQVSEAPPAAYSTAGVDAFAAVQPWAAAPAPAEAARAWRPLAQASAYTIQPTLTFTITLPAEPSNAEAFQARRLCKCLADVTMAVADAAAALLQPSAALTTTTASGGTAYAVSILFPTADQGGYPTLSVQQLDDALHNAPDTVFTPAFAAKYGRPALSDASIDTTVVQTGSMQQFPPIPSGGGPPPPPPSETPSVTPSQTPSPTASATPAPTTLPPPSETPSITPSATPSLTPAPTVSATPAPTSTPMLPPPSEAPSVTPSASPSTTPSPTVSVTPAPTSTSMLPPPSETPSINVTPAFQLQPGQQPYATMAWTVRVTFQPGQLALATSLGRALQSSPGAVLAAFQAARGPASVSQLYYGMP